MSSEERKIEIRGFEHMKKSSIAICSIVRDCNKQLAVNIPIVEKLRHKFKESHIFIFENDSKDGTKKTLKNWEKKSKGVYISINDFNTKTIDNQSKTGVNRYFSYSRINKMALYRNEYLKMIENTGINYDYVMVIDLDVEKIYPDGIANSFGQYKYWDAITANGFSYSPSLRLRYHDTYALVEMGNENIPQTEGSISFSQHKWGFLRRGSPLCAVYSAHGGLSIYKYEAIKKKRYRVILNKDPRVEVRCEHFGICHDIRQSGFKKIFVNPSMVIKYQGIKASVLKRIKVKLLGI